MVAGPARPPRLARVRIQTTGTGPPRQRLGPAPPTVDASNNLSAERLKLILPTEGAVSNRLAERPGPILPTVEAQGRSWVEPPSARRRAADGRANYWEEAPRLIRPTAAGSPHNRGRRLSVLACHVRENPASRKGCGAQPHGDSCGAQPPSNIRRSASRQCTDHLEPYLARWLALVLRPVVSCTFTQTHA